MARGKYLLGIARLPYRVSEKRCFRTALFLWKDYEFFQRLGEHSSSVKFSYEEVGVFEPCYCTSGKSYVACCGRLHAGSSANTAEELMRSRYTAFCRGDVAYLLRSWAVESRPVSFSLDPKQEWTGLQIEHHEATGPDTAIVRFTATWRKGIRKGQLVETSRFRREGEGWVYIDGA
jgi:SEC-C motif-containing protein